MVMERSPLTSGRSATPADINRYGWPTSIGTGGRHQSECPADIIGMRRQKLYQPLLDGGVDRRLRHTASFGIVRLQHRLSHRTTS